ncbi:hypothetical protein ACHAXS_005941 [Conticribra weissflogii]
MSNGMYCRSKKRVRRSGDDNDDDDDDDESSGGTIYSSDADGKLVEDTVQNNNVPTSAATVDDDSQSVANRNLPRLPRASDRRHETSMGEAVAKSESTARQNSSTKKDSTENHSSKTKSRSLPDEAKTILCMWYDEHCRNPTKDEKQELLRSTGIEPRQLANWFAYTRRRAKMRDERGVSPGGHPLNPEGKRGGEGSGTGSERKSGVSTDTIEVNGDVVEEDIGQKNNVPTSAATVDASRSVATHPSASASKTTKKRSLPDNARNPHKSQNSQGSHGAGSSVAGTSSESASEADLETRRKEKEQFLMFVRVLLKYLEQRDQELHAKAKKEVRECYEKNKAGDPNFASLTSSMKSRLRAVVGESYWKKAESFLHHFIARKEGRHRDNDEAMIKRHRQLPRQQPTKQQPTLQPPQQQLQQHQDIKTSGVVQQPGGPTAVGRRTTSSPPGVTAPPPIGPVPSSGVDSTQNQAGAAKKMPLSSIGKSAAPAVATAPPRDAPDADTEDVKATEECSKYSGVRQSKQIHKFVAFASQNDRLGAFDVAADAARAHDIAIIHSVPPRDCGHGNDEESSTSSDDGSERRDSGTKSKPQEQQQQSTRASSRRHATRNFSEIHSDDDEFVQMISTHTNPSGNYSEDWTQSKHYFKMPRESQVHRKWVTRTTFEDHCLGQKMHCPQVGDSVVYVPRAHYEILQKYPIPGYSGPWKSWQTQSNWHVVRCRVTHIRYRFPYEMYYRSHVKEDRLRSVAAVLTLEITGIPSSSAERGIPWPSPSFVSAVSTRTRSHDSKFEVTLFECNQEDFVIPEYLYTWRLQSLEKAIRQNGGEADGIEVRISFPPDSNGRKGDVEDPKFVTYDATLRSFLYDDINEFHLQNSGFNALSLKWLDGNDDDDIITASAWSVDVKGSLDSFPIVTTLSDEITTKINQALDQVQGQDSSRRDLFRELVDTRVYIDYLDMIEVPMYLARIRKRLRCKYYTNKDSVVADMDLLKENCYKYNEEGNGYFAMASDMYNEFKALVDAIIVPQTLRHDDCAPFHGIADDFSTSGEPVKCEASLSTKSLRRNQTQSSTKNNSRVSRSSVFENLPHLGSAESSLSVETSNNDVSLEGPVNGKTHSPRRSLRHSRLPTSQSIHDDGNCKIDTVHSTATSRSKQRQTRVARQQDTVGAIRKCGRESPSPRRSLRHSRKTLDHTDDKEDEVAEPTKLTRSTRQQGNTETSDLAKRGTRSSSRRKSKPIYTEEGSDEEESSSVSSQGKIAVDDESCSSDEEETKQTKLKLQVRPRKSSNQLSLSLSGKKNPESKFRGTRSSSRSKSEPSYVEKSSDDDDLSDYTHQSSDASIEKCNGDDDGDEYSDYESEYGLSDGERNKINLHRSKRRRRGDDSTSEEDAKEPPRKRGRPRKKTEPSYKNRDLQSSYDSSRNKSVRGYQYYPDLPSWPNINPRKVQRVAKQVLSKLRSLDTEKCFENPVHEEYPDMADEYLKMVSKPMSFSTIEQLQIPNYESIGELQEDLILTFRNCCVFNGEDSEFHGQAM